MTPIAVLWREGGLPIEDGLFFADGRSYAVEVTDGRLVVVAELDLAENSDLSEANPFKHVTLENNTATITSTSGVTVTVDVDSPLG